MVSVAQRADGGRTRAWGETGAVELALERRAGFARGELERRRRVRARIARRGIDVDARRREVDRPGVRGGGRIGVSCRVGRFHLEAVRAPAESREALRART